MQSHAAPTSPLSENERPALERLRCLLTKHTDAHTGFLPPLTPLIELPAPFTAISRACAELASRYHGQGKDCRPWLDATFAEERPEWSAALAATTGRTLVEALMTKVSLLCHAYRWGFMPTDPSHYKLKTIRLPRGLETLWTEVAARLGTPRVGLFYTMVTNNWRLEGKPGGVPYSLEDLGSIRLIHSWLNPPEEEDLTSFITAALQMEALGRAAIDCMLRAYAAIEQDRPQELSYQLVVCRDAVRAMLDAFNNGVRKDRMKIPNFMSLVQPTMLWLLDHGDGPLEGASGPQACTVQLLDSFLGVPRETGLGSMILSSRKYMLPGHREVLVAADACSDILRNHVARIGDAQLTALHNAVLGTLLSWRLSHQKRGALYLKGDANKPPAAYASTGLVVGADQDRVTTFERAMAEHIHETEARELADPWAGRERTVEALFRHCTEAQRATFRAAAEFTTVPAGTVLLSIGQRRPGLYFLEKGSAFVLRGHGESNVVIGLVSAGELFGEMSLLENEPASAEVRARTECIVGRVPAERIYELMRDDSSFGAGLYLGLAKLLSARLRRVNRILPELLDNESIGVRPLQAKVPPGDATMPAWERYCRANAYHRDFWPLWVLSASRSADLSSLPASSTLADLLAAGSPEAQRLPAGGALLLGAGALTLRLSAASQALVIDPSRSVLAACAHLPGVSATRHENIRRLAQGFGFIDAPSQERVGLDLLANFHNDQALVEILDWAHGKLLPGGELFGLAFATTAEECPVAQRHDLPLGTLRTEDQINDLLTRSRFRTAEPTFVRRGACLLEFSVRRRS